jgi:hypothetical protein
MFGGSGGRASPQWCHQTLVRSRHHQLSLGQDLGHSEAGTESHVVKHDEPGWDTVMNTKWHSGQWVASHVSVEIPSACNGISFPQQSHARCLSWTGPRNRLYTSGLLRAGHRGILKLVIATEQHHSFFGSKGLKNRGLDRHRPL